MSQRYVITGHCPGAGGKNVLLVGGELPRKGAPVGLEAGEAQAALAREYGKSRETLYQYLRET